MWMGAVSRPVNCSQDSYNGQNTVDKFKIIIIKHSRTDVCQPVDIELFGIFGVNCNYN